ncbi:hypothetical protein QL285_067695 [Trifolium repens]|nr:hypothetical protein QL285_067695 [Trifolium repens]
MFYFSLFCFPLLSSSAIPSNSLSNSAIVSLLSHPNPSLLSLLSLKLFSVHHRFTVHHRVTASLSSILSDFFPSHAQASSVHHHVLQQKQDTGLSIIINHTQGILNLLVFTLYNTIYGFGIVVFFLPLRLDTPRSFILQSRHSKKL